MPELIPNIDMADEEGDDRPHFELDVANMSVMEPFGIEIAHVDNPLRDVERLYEEVQSITDEFEEKSSDDAQKERVPVERDFLDHSYEMTVPEDRRYGEDAEELGAIFEIYEMDISKGIDLDDLTPEAQQIVKSVQQIREVEGDTKATSIKDTIEAIQRSINSDPDDQKTWWTVDSESADTILTYFTVVSSVIELRSAQLLRYLLIDEEYRTDNDIIRWIEERMNQHRRESLLYSMELIDGATKHDLQEVRGYRNEIVHDPLGRSNIKLEEIHSKIESGYSAVHEIDQLAKENIDEEG